MKTDAETDAGVFLGINGSPRKNGNSDVLLRHIAYGIPKWRTRFKGVHLRDYRFGPCIGCERCRQDGRCTGLKDGMSLLYPAIWSAKGLVLVSPTHHYNITAWMKSFIDRLYCFYIFDHHRPGGWSSRLARQNRKAVLAAVCEQASAADMGFTLDAMRRPLEALGYEIVGELPVFGIFDKGKVKEEGAVLASAEGLGKTLAEAIAGNGVHGR